MAPRNRGPIPSGFGDRSRLLLLESAARVLPAWRTSAYKVACGAACNFVGKTA
jgi:hypothetical protein